MDGAIDTLYGFGWIYLDGVGRMSNRALNETAISQEQADGPDSPVPLSFSRASRPFAGNGKAGLSWYLRTRQQLKRAALLVKGVAGFVGVLVVIGFCILVGREVFRHTIDVEPVPAPKPMTENGYSPEVIARQLRDSLADAESRARTTMRGPEVSLNTDLPDITVPAVGVSVDTIAAQVRALFGIRSRPSVSGEFVAADPKGQTARLRLRLDRRAFFVSDPVPMDAPDTALQSGALAIFGQVMPYIEAAALYSSHSADAGKMVDKIIGSRLPRADENVIRAFNLRGLIYMDQHDYRDAQQAFRSAVGFDARFAIGHINLGNALRAQGKLGPAEAEYRSGMELQPDDPIAYNNLGAILADEKHTEAAMAAYKKAGDLDAGYAVPHNNLANLLQGGGKIDEAISEYRKAIALDPSLASPHVGLAVIFLNRRNLAEAAAEFRKTIEIDDRASATPSRLDVDVRQTPQFEERASEQFVWSVARPREIPHFGLAYVLAEQHKTEEAIAEYRKALDVAPNDAAAHNNLGNALRDQHNIDAAMAEYRTAIQLDPKYASPHYNLGLALRDQHRTEEEIAEYRKAIELDPKNSAAHDNLGLALQDQHRTDEAIAEYHNAISLDPKNSAAHDNLGNALRDQHKTEEAIAEYHQSIALDPTNSAAHDNLGNAFRDEHRTEEAIAEYHQSIALDPKNPIAHYNLANALRDQHKIEEAIGEYRKAIDLDPKDVNAYYNLSIAIQQMITPATATEERVKLLAEACAALRTGGALLPAGMDYKSQMQAIDARLQGSAHCRPG